MIASAWLLSIRGRLQRRRRIKSSVKRGRSVIDSTTTPVAGNGDSVCRSNDQNV